MSIQVSEQGKILASRPLAALDPERGHPRRWAILAVLGTVAFMAQLDFFIVNVALDGIGKSFPAASVAGVSWVLSGYAIVFAAMLVPAGRLADQWGGRRVLLYGVVVFTLTSAIAAASPNLGVLIAARALQAIGAAMIVPTSLGLLYPNFPARQHTLVVGLWAGVAGVAASAGPSVGGLLVTLDWRWIFVINIPIGIVTVIAGAILLPEARQPKGAPLPDPVSVVSLLGAVSLLVLATVQGPGWGWGDFRTTALLAAAALATAVTVQRTLRAKSPLIEKDLFRSGQFTGATIALLLFFTSFAIVLLGNALFLQGVWHYDPLHTGLALSPAPIVGTALASNAGPIQRRFGRIAPAALGTLFLGAAGIYWTANVNASPNYWVAIFPGAIMVGLGAGLAQAPLFASASTLAPERATTGSAVLNMSRQIGSAIGVAILVALTAHPTISGFQHAWLVQAGLALAAGITLVIVRSRVAR